MQVYVALSTFCEDDDAPRRLLNDAGFEVRENTTGRRLRHEEMAEAIGAAQAVIAGIEPYDSETLNSLPSLRCISRCGVGTDAIDLDAARRLNIAVLNTPDEVTEPVAQFTVALILSLARNIPRHSAALRDGRWQRYSGFLLSEWTIGLIGFGRIGRAVERYLRPFGSRIVVTDPNLKKKDIPEGVELVDLSVLLKESDLISVHAARPASDGSLLGAHEFSKFKRGSSLVNTARGYLIDEQALYDVLSSGHLSGAALDVFQREPYEGSLAALPQVLCTPHVSTLTKASRQAMELRAAKNVADFLRST